MEDFFFAILLAAALFVLWVCTYMICLGLVHFLGQGMWAFMLIPAAFTLVGLFKMIFG